MFSSNQIFSISGDLNPEEITKILNFVEEMSGYNFASYQITSDDRFALGWLDETNNSWTKFQFDYDNESLSRIICNHLSSLKSKPNGFKADVIERSLSDEKNGIKRPFYGIIVFSPYNNYFSK